MRFEPTDIFGICDVEALGRVDIQLSHLSVATRSRKLR